jgi:hypothetical protein
VLVAVLVLVVLLLVADRVAARVAASQIADRVRASQDLSSTPSVSVRGFPFLTQVVRGRYDAISVTARQVQRDDLLFSQVHVVLRGVQVGLGELTSGSLPDIPVRQGTAAVSLTYAELNAYLAPRRLQVAGDAGALRVTGTVDLPVVGPVSLSAPMRLTASGDSLTLVPEVVHSLAGTLPGPARTFAVDLLTVRLSLRGLPFGVRLDSAHVTSDGLAIVASASDITLPAGSTASGNPDPAR